MSWYDRPAVYGTTNLSNVEAVINKNVRLNGPFTEKGHGSVGLHESAVG